MRIYKLEKITKGDYPIIRITFKKWYGGFISRDICRYSLTDKYWKFLDNSQLIIDVSVINNFYHNDKDVYLINKQK